jgi:hypothetical protein
VEEEDSDDEGKEANTEDKTLSKKQGKVQERFFILQGNHLKYFAPGGTEPKGVLDMNASDLQFGAGNNPMSRANEVSTKQAKVVKSSDGLGFTMSLPSGHEIEAIATSTSDRDEWVEALEAVLRTTHSNHTNQSELRESLAFADMTADEKDVAEDHKRRIFRLSPYLF